MTDNILRLVEGKFNFRMKDFTKYDNDRLNSIITEIDRLENDFHEFYRFYNSSKNPKIRVEKYSKAEIAHVKRKINDSSVDIVGRLESGWILTTYGVYFYFGNVYDKEISFDDMASAEWKKALPIIGPCSFEYLGTHIGIPCNLLESYKSFFRKFSSEREKWKDVLRVISNRMRDQVKSNIQSKLEVSKKNFLDDLDKDSNGEIDLIENDFNKLLNKNQKTIISIDRSYVHQFVKVSNYIKTKKENTQKIFESIRDASSQEGLEKRVGLLKNQIHAYELVVFHSLNMIGSLVSDDLITFYEIYESFDKLGMFNSNWENEVSAKLTNIGNSLDDLLHSIHEMEQNIVGELSYLSYVTEESFESLNSSLSEQLKEVNSSINTNNLLTGIQSYQLYKLNQNTKSLRS